jgi:hypothetical protein
MAPYKAKRKATLYLIAQVLEDEAINDLAVVREGVNLYIH